MVPLVDHGFLFGDSLYEVIRIYDRRFFAWTEHMERFVRSGERVGISIPHLLPEVDHRARELLSKLREPEAALRIFVTRGVGKLHIDFRSCEKPEIYMAAWKLDTSTFPDDLRLMVSQIRRNSILALDPAIKSGNYLNNVLAYREAVQMGYDDALMLNPDGKLSELTTSNIAWVNSKNTIETPRVDSGILHGVTRRIFLERFKAKEGNHSEDALRKAKEVFVLSTFKEVLPVTEIRFADGEIKRYPMGAKTAEFQKSFRKVVLDRLQGVTAIY